MIDHLYLSDKRAYEYHSFFNMIVDTTYLTPTSTMTIHNLDPTTKHIYFQVNADISGSTDTSGSHSTIQSACNELMQSIKNHEKILLYSDNYYNTAMLIYTYLSTKYHFSKNDVRNMINTRPFNPGLTQAFYTVLSP